MTDRRTVTADEINTAVERWKIMLWNFPHPDASPAQVWSDWMVFLGDNIIDNIVYDKNGNFTVTEQVYNKIKLLNSPHYKTLLKIMEARK